MNPDDVHKLPLDHPARLLMIAHKRLSSAHPISNGTKSVVVAAYGDYVVRLMNVPTMTTNVVSPLWVDLHDAFNDRSLDGAGCNDLLEAITAVEDFLAEAKIRNAEASQT